MLKAAEKSVSQHHLKNFQELKTYIRERRKEGQAIVLTQGVFDLIHEGHARYLAMAKSLGDILIVGVDSDALTKKRKGPSRPVVPESERVEMLTHLRHVDAVIVRDIGDEIGELIKLVKPDVLVASESTKDFTKSLIEEYQPYCKKIVIYPPQATTSTTARIRQLTIDGAESLATEINKLTTEFIEKIRNA